MRQRATSLLYEVLLVAIGFMVDEMTAIAPIWIWPTFAITSVVGLFILNYHSINRSLKHLIKRVRRSSTAIDLRATQEETDLVRFRECLPHVQRSSKLISPYTGALGTFNIGLQVFQSGSAEFGKIATELQYLADELSAIGIQSPVYGERRAMTHLTKFVLG